jgi:hypothetical protein
MVLRVADVKKGEVSNEHHPLGGSGGDDAWSGAVATTMREGAE